MQNKPQLSAEMEKLFDEEFAVQKHSWGDTLSWADSGDDEPNRIKHFIAVVLDNQRDKIINQIEMWFKVHDESDKSFMSDDLVDWLREKEL